MPFSIDLISAEIKNMGMDELTGAVPRYKRQGEHEALATSFYIFYRFRSCEQRFIKGLLNFTYERKSRE